MARTRNARSRRPNLPAWKTDHPALTQVRALAPLALLEADARDTAGLNAAVDQWESLDDGVKEYLRDRMAYNALILGDAQRRLMARIEDHLGSIRTGTRLTVEELKALVAVGGPSMGVDFADAEAFDGDFVDDEEDDEDFVDEEEDEDFVDDEDDVVRGSVPDDVDLDGVDAHELFDRMEAGEKYIEAPGAGSEQAAQPKQPKRRPAKRKAKAPAKRRASSTQDNGAGKAVTPEVFDKDGNQVSPEA